MDDRKQVDNEELARERSEFLQQLEEWLDTPMIVLAFVWLVLLVIEFIWGLGRFLELLVNVIWIIFIFDFLVRFILAPRKIAYLKGSWLTAVSLFLPALRIFRLFRILRLIRLARATRSLQLVRIISSLNRGMRALRASMGRRRFGYVLALTFLVLLVGSAGMYAVEQPAGEERMFTSYGDALWYTTMLLTTIGSNQTPLTTEGRLLTVLLAIYSLTILGYLTAALATYFIGREAEDATGNLPSAHSLDALRAEIQLLQAEIRRLTQDGQTPSET